MKYSKTLLHKSHYACVTPYLTNLNVFERNKAFRYGERPGRRILHLDKSKNRNFQWSEMHEICVVLLGQLRKPTPLSTAGINPNNNEIILSKTAYGMSGKIRKGCAT